MMGGCPQTGKHSLKVLLVDDEQPILDGLKQLIPWERLGVAAIETALNGREALTALESFHPHIMITDIRMPVMDGLELLRRAKERMPDTRCIVLCGYQDFEYAREAMRYGAVRYLVKPVEEEELADIVTEIRKDLQTVKNEKLKVAELNRKLVESTPFLRNKLLYSIMTGEIKDAGEAGSRLRSFGIESFPESFICLVMEFETIDATGAFTGENIELIRFAAANIADELVNAVTFGIVFYMLEKQIIVIMDATKLQRHTQEALARDITHHISGFLKMPVTIGVSRVSCGLTECPKSFNEAKNALKYKLLLGKGKVIFYDTVASGFSSGVRIPGSLWKRLENCIITGDRNSVAGVVGDLVNELRGIRGADPSEILSKCREELLLIRRSLEDTGLNSRTISQFINRFDSSLQCMTLNELEEQFTSVFCEIANEVLCTSTAGIKAVIGQIRQYIDQNYASMITLNTISEKFYINASYASRLFKQELSENFIDYLTERRMNEAMKLLQCTELTVYEITEKTGYGNPKYFSQLFKKHTGMSPREFRDRARK